MADVTLKYKGATIGELSESGSKTIETAGKYCEADISLEYVKPSGGNHELWTASGDLEFTDQHVHTITLPINCPCNTVKVVLRAIKSGTVTDGVVTEDEVLTARIAKNVIFGWIGRTYINNRLPPLVNVKGTGYANVYTRQIHRYEANSVWYATSSVGLTNTTLLGADVATITNTRDYTSLDNGSVVISTKDYKNSYMFCYEGIYMKFHYDIVAWDE